MLRIINTHKLFYRKGINSEPNSSEMQSNSIFLILYDFYCTYYMTFSKIFERILLKEIMFAFF